MGRGYELTALSKPSVMIELVDSWSQFTQEEVNWLFQKYKITEKDICFVYDTFVEEADPAFPRQAFIDPKTNATYFNEVKPIEERIRKRNEKVAAQTG